MIGGGGLPVEAFVFLRFGVEGRSGVAKSEAGCTVAASALAFDFRAFLTFVPELLLAFFGLLVEPIGRLRTVVGACAAATLVDRLRDMLRARRKARLQATASVECLSQFVSTVRRLINCQLPYNLGGWDDSSLPKTVRSAAMVCISGVFSLKVPYLYRTDMSKNLSKLRGML